MGARSGSRIVRGQYSVDLLQTEALRLRELITAIQMVPMWLPSAKRCGEGRLDVGNCVSSARYAASHKEWFMKHLGLVAR